MSFLTFAYIANLVILVPVALPTLLRPSSTDEGRFAESSGWRMLVGSLWLSIMVLSVLGLFHPIRYAPVLLLQWIYKSVWLLTYALPRFQKERRSEIPWGITGSFIMIVVLWPFLIPWRALF
jgi:hypothetical protein